ncbi:PQQ-dependent sugar dehydrogenase [Pseudogemmobacter sonorensis]|uniref:PQQ-dependent sugar dehydrogenase n=1 Tax=Pseudogemmobacter sonorensis TaxID=2989681 RepID=UPI0036AF9880
MWLSPPASALLLALLPLFYATAPRAEIRAETGMIATSAGEMRVEAVALGLNEPWGLAFLPDGSPLVTERGGRLLLLRDGAARALEGVPQVAATGQGGLLDVLVASDFAQTREIWLSFAAPLRGGAATAAGGGRLSDDATRIEGFETVFTGDVLPGGRHFGARLVETAPGRIVLTTGDRGTGPSGHEAQDPRNAIGKVIALTRAGADPSATGAEGWGAGVVSLGHRNIQGAALMPGGGLLVSEHGARGGDEINLVAPGRNYGWPVISYGVDYDGSRIGEGQEKPGMEQPAHYWDPSIAPSGLMVYSGALVPEWRGHVFAGSLNSDFISRLDPSRPGEGGWSEERIAAEETGRVRDIREGPDGAIWFLSVTRGALYRLLP